MNAKIRMRGKRNEETESLSLSNHVESETGECECPGGERGHRESRGSHRSGEARPGEKSRELGNKIRTVYTREKIFLGRPGTNIRACRINEFVAVRREIAKF
jgi:hypothetical protein